MNKERMNQEIRNADQVMVAMTRLDPKIYAAAERIFDGMKAVSGADFLKAFDTSVLLLMNKVGDPTKYAVAMKTSIASDVILSLFLIPKNQATFALFDQESIKSDEAKKLIQSHADAKHVYNELQPHENTIPTYEDYKNLLSTCADQETVKQLLFHSSGSEAPIEILTGEFLPVIKRAPKELGSGSIHKIRAAIHSCDIDEQAGKATIIWAEDPSAMALINLIGRKLKFTFDPIADPQLGKLLQLAAATEVNFEMNVTITRSLERFDQKSDRINIGELIRVLETERQIRRRLQEIQTAYLLEEDASLVQSPLL
ncbi:MAG: hypothetical protein WCG50_06355 [Rhodoferax sp.]|uniref:hypothetical protein n=1 Tax=Rhodoferax sp. TaxID=50421 RepID=UPI0030188DCC